MGILNRKQHKELINKTFAIVQKFMGLGIPVQIGSFQFETFNEQRIANRVKKGPICSYPAPYDKNLFMKIKLLPKGAMGKITVGKINYEKEQIDSFIHVLKNR
jgi:hypothetical protein